MNIKKYKAFLNEEFSDKDFSFKSVIKSSEVNFQMDSTDDESASPATFFVEWFMDFDIRKNGINSISPVITRVSGTYFIGNEAGEDFEFEFDSGDLTKSNEWECEHKLYNDIRFGHGIYPSDLDVDLKTKKITVKF